MSGGALTTNPYVLYELAEEVRESVKDERLAELLEELCEVIHALDYYLSGDISEKEYKNIYERFWKKVKE